MLVKQELINKIKDYFDLNIYETKVWLALLGKGVASAGEIAEISGVPRSRAYDVLESLEKKGFAIAKLGKPVKYLGIKPTAIIEKLKNDVRERAEEKVSTLVNIKDTNEFNELQEIYEQGINPIKKGDVSAALKGKSNISNYLRELIENAGREVIICTSASEVKSKTRLFKDTLTKLKENKTRIKMALSGDPALVKQLSKALGVKIKKIEIDAKFFIIDRKEILLYLSKDRNNEDIAIWLNSEFFANAFAGLFERAVDVNGK